MAVTKIDTREGKIILGSATNELYSIHPDVNLLRIDGKLNEVIISEGLLGSDDKINIDLDLITSWNINGVAITAPSNTTEKFAKLQSNYFTTSGGKGGMRVSLDTAHVDQAGRVRVSEPIPLGDYKLMNDRLPLFFYDKVNGTGTVAWDSAIKSHGMDTAADGDYVIVQTAMYHNYFAGKAHFVELTTMNFDAAAGALKRAGYFRSEESAPYTANQDGFYLETNNNGEHELVIMNNGTEILRKAQSDWDDPLDGTGDSGITIDWDDFHVYQFNFLWLGGTGLTLGLVVGDYIHQVYSYIHSTGPNDDKLIFSSPNQPVRFELRQTGAGAHDFDPVCCTVATEGSAESGDIGSTRSIHSNYNTAISCASSGTEYVLALIRLKDLYKDVTIDLLDVEVYSTSPNDHYAWRLLLNPSIDIVAGASDIDVDSLTWVDVRDSAIQEWYGATGTYVIGTDANDQGHVMGAGTGASQVSRDKILDSARKLGSDIDGNRDFVALTLKPLPGTTNVAAFATIKYKEFI